MSFSFRPNIHHISSCFWGRFHQKRNSEASLFMFLEFAILIRDMYSYQNESSSISTKADLIHSYSLDTKVTFLNGSQDKPSAPQVCSV